MTATQQEDHSPDFPFNCTPPPSLTKKRRAAGAGTPESRLLTLSDSDDDFSFGAECGTGFKDQLSLKARENNGSADKAAGAGDAGQSGTLLGESDGGTVGIFGVLKSGGIERNPRPKGCY